MRKPLPPAQKKDFEQTNDESMKWLELVRQHSIDIREATVTFDPASIAASTTVEQTVTVTGLKTDDIILAIIKPTLTAGIAVGQGRVSTADTLAITYINASVGVVDPASEEYTVIYIKNSRA
jgi:hypothetical protein